MRKKIIQQENQTVSSIEQHNWLDLEQLVQVEVTSEEEAHPIEVAFTDGSEDGWKAAQPGEQTIRLIFDAPQRISRIKLLFRGNGQERTQEFLLRWQSARDQSYQQIVRQQYNFSPQYASEELENYAVELADVRVLELYIVPDISGKAAYASLAQLRLS
ncbi:hypothetical protein [Pontibacter harenae]|uniref:hypothetical protein n=1 Tax=Pontibacter harenae TaxID=2894083 RepID=UPI001E2C2024|nr:hypothetical protein [Pontibacter harenae]MCC9166449.1 hypothetical protein [Pontibacter harenae]